MSGRLFLRVLVTAVALLVVSFTILYIFVVIVGERYSVLGKPRWMITFVYADIALACLLTIHLIWRSRLAERRDTVKGLTAAPIRKFSFLPWCFLAIILAALFYFVGDYFPKLGNAELGALPKGGKDVYRDIRNGDRTQYGRMGAMLVESKQYRKAFFYLKAGAERGDPEACLLLGQMYDRGNAGTQNDEKAIQWMQAAVSQGYAGASDVLHQSGSYQRRLKLAAATRRTVEENDRLIKQMERQSK